MSNAETLNRLLHSPTVAQHHSVAVGQELDIEMPRVPLTGDTEFIELRADWTGVGAKLDMAKGGTLEGRLLPRTVHARAIRPGRGVIRIDALDALSGQPIEGVDPLEIVVDVKEP